MEDTQLRLECLKIAAALTPNNALSDAERTVEDAELFFEYITGTGKTTCASAPIDMQIA